LTTPSLGFGTGTALLAIAVMSMRSGFFDVLFYVAFGYWVVLLALHSRLYLRLFDTRADYSYGIYVFAFPIQQTVVSVLGARNPLFVFALSHA